MTLAVICPTRGRPDNARQAFLSFLATKYYPTTNMVFAVDEDDPELPRYEERFEHNGDWYHLPLYITRKSHNMAEALNECAGSIGPSTEMLGFIGDDHRFRTRDWDLRIVADLWRHDGGIAYANDLMQSENLPTQVFMRTLIVQTLGWMALPGCRHLYLDNAWKDLGEALDMLAYFPDIVIEHMHPAGGKAVMDEGYARVNSSDTYNHDAAVYGEWKSNGFQRDVERVRAAFEREREYRRLE